MYMTSFFHLSLVMKEMVLSMIQQILRSPAFDDLPQRTKYCKAEGHLLQKNNHTYLTHRRVYCASGDSRLDNKTNG
ncbi:hypothetical protein T11_17997 [Trichinella zimbabwensis]|uniref:Uncharacterized protein n=1 Tax=Trichinella zimbabwensis TaxID=268475 RepID=A0A0V1GET1_9BILA|nr:hypothetical protein T11_17997 [Trichinella zimbabwensis]